MNSKDLLDEDIAFLRKILENIKETATVHKKMDAALDRIAGAASTNVK